MLTKAEELAEEPNLSSYNAKEVVEAFKEKFGIKRLKEACSRLSDLEMKVFLMTLHVLFPYLPTLNLSKAEKFRTLEELKAYVNAMIISGVAEDEADKLRGVIYILGQSESGKTSFVKTFTRFIENPTDQPKAILTQENVDMHTQILETSDVNILNKRKLSVNLKEIRALNNMSKLISFSEIKEEYGKEGRKKESRTGFRSNLDKLFRGNRKPMKVDGTKEQRIALKLVDYGGHEVKTFLFNI